MPLPQGSLLHPLCHLPTLSKMSVRSSYYYILLTFPLWHWSLSSVQFSQSVVFLFATPWTAAHQASLSITNSWSLLKLMSIESVMPSNHLILCHPLLLPSIFPSIRVFSKDSGMSEIIASPPTPIADNTPVSNSSHLSAQCQPLYASYTGILYFSRCVCYTVSCSVVSDSSWPRGW